MMVSSAMFQNQRDAYGKRCRAIQPCFQTICINLLFFVTSTRSKVYHRTRGP
ncbi:hypothetical protein B0H12DRAFT_1115488 [Mycena haematopus]|nr:hypothetical protein B0H12DRAFT_1115488 [Mycena haematopus]